MRLPNGYGSVVNLGKRRRKPHAVRILTGYKKNKKGTVTPTYKYLAYFEKPADAITYLAQRNSGQLVKEHVSLAKQPTFTEVYEEVYRQMEKSNKKLSKSTFNATKLAYKQCATLHNMKMVSITVSDVEDCVWEYNEKSKSTVLGIKNLLAKMYRHAKKHKYVDENIIELVDFEWSGESFVERKEFSSEEIDFLWKNIDKPYVDYILMMIYTGCRISEFLKIENERICLAERYMIGGIKTEAGIDRAIPIHKKIIPIIEKYRTNGKYLITNKKDKPYTYPRFHVDVWTPTMTMLKLDHTPHDTRHTLKSMLDRTRANKICVDMILGHKVENSNDRTYIHKTITDLIEAIDMI